MIYCFLVWLLQPALLAYWLWRGRKQRAYWANLAERFGYGYRFKPGFDYWLHAVSVGETRAAEPLIKALLKRQPEARILITHTTPTGRETSEALFGERVSRCYLPVDTPGAMQRFFKAAAPKQGIVLETEWWPNCLREAQRVGCPVSLVNARLSAKSAKGYACFGQLSRDMLQRFKLIAAQTEADAERLQSLGASKVSVTGNLKFDVAIERSKSLDYLLSTHTPLWLAASTREGEEAAILEALRTHPLRQRAKLLLVPRHPQRFEAVAQLATQLGFIVGCRSGEIPAQCDLIVGDSLGEMAAYYSQASVVLMGGSLLPHGSQNFIEPCALGLAVVLGPSTYNFAQAAEQALALQAVRPVNDVSAGLDAVLQLLNDPSEREQMGAAALAWTRLNLGATVRTLELLPVPIQ
jgi:3-deoxy-D-manno-octulosonic-acid transferase